MRPGMVPVAPAPEPAVVEELAPRADPRVLAEQIACGRRQLLRRPTPRVQVAEASVTRHHVDHRAELGEIDPVVALEMDLAVIRGDEQRRARRQHREQIGDEPIRELELARVVAVVQSELVRDVVDARVVRVHEPLARRDQPGAVLDEHRGRIPTGEARTAQVRVGEAAVAELRLRDHRNLAAQERGVALHVERVRRPRVGDGPAQDVEHVGTHPHPVAEHAVLRRREPGRDRGERGGGGRRRHGRDAVAGHRADRRQDGRVRLRRVPPEPVEHEQHDRIRGPGDLGDPAPVLPTDERGDDARDRCAIERGAHGFAGRFHDPANLREHGGVKVSTRGD